MIHAQSLAHVVSLADNPPLQVRQDVSTVARNPLTFYIARVPGSRGTLCKVACRSNIKITIFTDVFLTTVKPLDKTVRAEDVQSCLYYVHVDSYWDEELLREEKERMEVSRTDLTQPLAEEKAESTSVRRKPLQQQHKLVSRDRPKLPLKSRSHPQPVLESGDQQVSRKPVAGAGHDRQAACSRKLIGPRLMEERSGSYHSSPLQDIAQSQNMDVRRWSAQPDLTLTSDPYKEKQAQLDEIYAVNAAPLIRFTDLGHDTTTGIKPGHLTGLVSKRDLLQQIEPSLTLIRRYGDIQANVSRIEPSGGTIEMLSPGYSKYGNQGSPSDCHGTENSQSEEHNVTPFRCTLQVKGQTIRSHRSQASDGVQSSLRAERPIVNIRRHSQQSSTESANSANNGEAYRSNRYIFKNPWDSVCEFSAGVAGRSLKCKDLNLGSSATNLSELRFNLPSSQALRSSPKIVHPGTPRESKRSSFFAKNHQRTSSSFSLERAQPHIVVPVSDNYDEDRLDLSLGQEHAGGGFGGKQAKLGKLIIQPEGLYMLDLLVAANMAMWWKVYDKFT